MNWDTVVTNATRESAISLRKMKYYLETHEFELVYHDIDNVGAVRVPVLIFHRSGVVITICLNKYSNSFSTLVDLNLVTFEGKNFIYQNDCLLLGMIGDSHAWIIGLLPNGQFLNSTLEGTINKISEFEERGTIVPTLMISLALDDLDAEGLSDKEKILKATKTRNPATFKSLRYVIRHSSVLGWISFNTRVS